LSYSNAQDEDEDEHPRERAAVAGENVRRLLSRRAVSRPGDDATLAGDRAGSAGSLDGGELSAETSPSTEYLACFTVPTRGRRLQPEAWISHAGVSTADELTTASSLPPYETLVTTRCDFDLKQLFCV